MAVMEPGLDKPEPIFLRLAYHFRSKRFNSLNDAVYNRQGIFFLPTRHMAYPCKTTWIRKKEHLLMVYIQEKNGVVALLTDSITRPNVIAFLPGETQLIIASSNPVKPNWYVYDVTDDELKNYF